MANRTVFFTAGTKIEDDIMLNLRKRIKAAFSSASISTTAPAAGTVMTFADLNSTYQAARQAIFALISSFGSFTLDNFQNKQMKAVHGIGIVEKTVGALENVCVAFYSGNLKAEIKQCAANNGGHRSSYTPVANRTNFGAHGTNSTNRSAYTALANSTNFGTVNNTFRGSYRAEANAANFSNYFNANRSSYAAAKNATNFSAYNSKNRTSFTAAKNGSNFNSNGKVTNRSSGAPFAYMAFHAAQGGTKSTVYSGVNKTNFGSFGRNSSKRSTFTAAKKGTNFSGHGNKSSNRSTYTAVKNNTNFANNGTNSTNRSSYTALTNSTNFGAHGTNATHRSNYAAEANAANFGTVNNTFRGSYRAEANAANFSGNNATFFSSYKPAFFASVQQTCIAVHSTFRVEGVDF